MNQVQKDQQSEWFKFTSVAAVVETVANLFDKLGAKGSLKNIFVYNLFVTKFASTLTLLQLKK
jgi:hypothetical protein